MLTPIIDIPVFITFEIAFRKTIFSSEILDSKPYKLQRKETSTLFLPIGGFTPGFIYCGFDGDKNKLKEMTNDGWQIVSFNSQNFQTQKRNGEPVSCNGNLYILERYK